MENFNEQNENLEAKKSLPISYLSDYGADEEVIYWFKEQFNIHTIGELLKIDRNNFSYDILLAVMNMGLLFDDDFKMYANNVKDINLAFIPVTKLNLPLKIKNALERAKLVSLGDLTAASHLDLLQIRGIGEKSLDELMNFIKNLDYDEKELAEQSKDANCKVK